MTPTRPMSYPEVYEYMTVEEVVRHRDDDKQLVEIATLPELLEALGDQMLCGCRLPIKQQIIALGPAEWRCSGCVERGTRWRLERMALESLTALDRLRRYAWEVHGASVS